MPTLVAGERSQRLELHGTQNPAARALTDLTLAKGATAGSERQTRSKGQAVLVCLEPLVKRIFDERFAVPRGNEQFIEGSKELYDSGIIPALSHTVRSAQTYGTKSKIHKTPEASVSNSEGSLPYPIRMSISYSPDDPLIGGPQPPLSRSAERPSPSEHRGAASQTPHSSGQAAHLTNLVNPPD